MSSLMSAPTGFGSKGHAAGDVRPHGYSRGQLQQFTPQQMQLFQQMFGQVDKGSYLSRLANGDQSSFEEMEAPAMRQFQGLQGTIASRFSQGGGGTGAMSARHSSGFNNEINQATSDFALQLQANRQNLQRQAIGDLHNMSTSLLGQRPYQRFLVQKPQKKNFGEQILGGLVTAGATGAGAYFGGPAGAYAGYQAGDAFNQSFNY